MPALYTIGQLADACRAKNHQIRYILERLHIEPAARAGKYRLFDRAALEKIAAELNGRQGVAHD